MTKFNMSHPYLPMEEFSALHVMMVRSQSSPSVLPFPMELLLGVVLSTERIFTYIFSFYLNILSVTWQRN
jgi:hypothetical protein